jgi:hypothetical protein
MGVLPNVAPVVKVDGDVTTGINVVGLSPKV